MRRNLVIAILLFQPALLWAQDAEELLDTVFTLEIEPASLIEALGVLRAETGVRFVYSPSSLPADQWVEVSAVEQPLRSVLDDLLQPLSVEYQVIGGQVVLRWAPPEQRVAFTQTIRGRVVDIDTGIPLVGVNIVVEKISPLRGASTNADGDFEIPGLPLGRHTLLVRYIGFESVRIPELLLTAGKEIVLDIELVPSPIFLDQVVVSETPDLYRPLNETAVVSARSFSVEHTQRYAASVSDPARMAQSFAGVSRSEDDLLNEVIVRGHSPKYTVWRLEGVEIPNPNHFGDDGHSSGGINMLSANMLTNSDFFTGSFPAEYGNALGGVFDVNLRRGNLDRREYSLGIGSLGLEGTAEGPFSRRYDGSYLVNYRYSTLGMMADLNLVQEDVIEYQDLAFNVHLPTKNLGNFGVFGVGGISISKQFAPRDSTKWSGPGFGFDEGEYEHRGIAGLSHRLVISPKSFLKTTLIAFSKEERDRLYAVQADSAYSTTFVDDEKHLEAGFRGQTTFQHKFNPRHVLQVGVSSSRLRYEYLFRQRYVLGDGSWNRDLDTSGPAQIWRAFTQWTFRPDERWRVHLGMHAARFNMSNETTVEPRLGVQWRFTEAQSISIGSGLHSQVEPIGIYAVHEIEKDPGASSLRVSKSWHNVIGYEHRLKSHMRLRAELYYDAGFDIPVSDSEESSFSVINTYSLSDVFYSTDGLINAGTTKNYGIDVAMERFFADGFYALWTGSLFRAQYTDVDGRSFPSRYDTRFMANLVGGVEFKMGRQRRDVFGINTRILFGGGNRYTPVDLEASVREGREIYDSDDAYAGRLKPYFRVDAGISYTINKPYLTHRLFFDAQNVIHHVNPGFVDYSRRQNQIFIIDQLGILPILGYKLTF